jgi:hypothetical protein
VASDFPWVVTPPPDDNPTRDIRHLEIAKVDFIGVDNFFASSLVAPVCENPLRDKKLIIELVWDKHLEYSQKEPQDLSSKSPLPCGVLHDHKEEGMKELDWTSELSR